MSTSALRRQSSKSPRETRKNKRVSIALEKNEIKLVPKLHETREEKRELWRSTKDEAKDASEAQLEEIAEKGLDAVLSERRSRSKSKKEKRKAALDLLEAKQISGKLAAEEGLKRITPVNDRLVISRNGNTVLRPGRVEVRVEKGPGFFSRAITYVFGRRRGGKKTQKNTRRRRH
jgi:hypothetical protein